MAIPLITITTRVWDPVTDTYFTGRKNLEEKKNIPTENSPYLFYVEGRERLPITDLLNSDAQTASKIGNLIPKVDEAILFVHGYNTTLEGAQKNAAIISSATKLQVIVFDWNSGHDVAIQAAKLYSKDADTATASVRSLNWLLYYLLRNMKLHILSHSMGSRIAAGSIGSIIHDFKILRKDVRHPYYSRYELMLKNIGHIFFKQPDIDIINMENFIKGSMSTIHGISNTKSVMYIYAHKDDKALKLSQEIHYDWPRVGQLAGAQELKSAVGERDYMVLINAFQYSKTRWYDFITSESHHSYFEDLGFQQNIVYFLTGQGNAAYVLV